MDVLTLCFSEKLPAPGNLALYSDGNDIKLNGQGFPPQIQRACLTTVYLGYQDVHKPCLLVNLQYQEQPSRPT